MRKHLLLALVGLFSICLVTKAEVYSGACGDNLTWELSEDGVLTISGIGKMEDYTENSYPWCAYKTSIKEVTIEDGVTSIGAYAFKNCAILTEITIPNSVISIGICTFFNCI